MRQRSPTTRMLQSKLELESKSTKLQLSNAQKEVKRYEDDLADAKAQVKSLIEQQGEMMGELKRAAPTRINLAKRLREERSQTPQRRKKSAELT